MFAESSGHGKTELAVHIGSLLGAQAILVDCTIMRRETDMFSSNANFLVEKNYTCRIVFLDEFEKAVFEVRQAILLPLNLGVMSAIVS